MIAFEEKVAAREKHFVDRDKKEDSIYVMCSSQGCLIIANVLMNCFHFC
jgi:hypothetical protein